MNETLSTIHSRKSVRRYTGQAVGRKDIETLLKAAMAAPSAGNRKPWAFVVIIKKEDLAGLTKGLPYAKMVQSAATAIVVCGVLSKALPDEEQPFWVQDCSAATQNILLAAESLGLGAVWTGVYPMPDRVSSVQAFLGLPQDVVPLNIIAVGHGTGAEKARDKFDPACIHWDRW